MSGTRILLVEDEQSIAEVLEYNLAKEGFELELDHRGDTALDGISPSSPL